MGNDITGAGPGSEDEAYLAILRLQRAYCDISTRRAWDQMDTVATDDALFLYHTASGVIEIKGAREFATVGRQTAQRYNFNILCPLNSIVSGCAGDVATGRCYFVELAEPADGTDWLEVYGVYEDEYLLTAEGWRMSRREYRPLARRSGARGEAFPMHGIPS